jgi:hypothetical protein
VLVEQCQRIGVADEPHLPRVAAIDAVADLHQRFAICVDQPLASTEFARRADHRLPRPLVGGRLEQQHLSGTTAGAPQAESGRDHLRVVDDQKVAVSKQLRQIMDVEMIGSGTPPIDQQPGRIAGFDRDLGDALGGQLVVEVAETHGAPRLRAALRTYDTIDA